MVSETEKGDDSRVAALFDRGFDREGRVIYLGGEADNDGKEADINYKTASNVVKAAYILDQDGKSPVRLIINSDGGELVHAFAIYDAIRGLRSPVTAEVFGRAHSAATVVLQAADKRIMHPYASLLIHEGQAEVPDEGVSPRIARATCRWDAKMTGMMYSLLAQRTPHDVAFWRNIGEQESYLSSRQAVRLGLADKVQKISFR